MSVKLRCPGCSAVNMLEPKDGVARCPDCGKAIRLKPKATDPDADERSKDSKQEDATSRPKKKKKKKRKAEKSRAKLWIGAGSALGVVAIVVIILLANGGGGGNGNGNGGGQKGDEPGAGGGPKKAVVEAPLPNIVADATPKIEYRVAAAEKPQWVALSSVQPPALWNLAADIAPNPPVTPAADLNIPIPLTPASSEVAPPVFAGLRGPFVVPAPQWKEQAYDEERDKRGVLVPKERPQPASPVIDIRTGKQVGGFSWRANTTKPGTRLSSDGRFLASPDPIRSFSGTRTAREGTLFVWEQGKDEPVKLQLDGSVRWMEFIGPTRLAAVSFKPAPHFSVWDVATNKLEYSTPLQADRFDKPHVRNGDGDAKYPFYPDDILGTVSPTGKYVAIPTLSGVLLITSTDGKEVGFIPLGDQKQQERLQFQALTFSPDGASLHSIVSHSFPRPYTTREAPSTSWPRKPTIVNKGVQGRGSPAILKRWEVATGRLTLERAYHSAVNPGFPYYRGNVYPGPTPDTFLFGYGQGGEGPIGRVLETVAGTTADNLECDPVYVGANGQLLGVFKVDAKNNALRNVRYDEKAIQERAGAKLATVAERPAPRPADRAGTAVGPPQPPAKWTAPPAVAPFETPSVVASLPSLPTVFDQSNASDLRPVPKDELLPREELHWQPVDPKTGQALGKAVQLYPWTYPPHELPARMKPNDIPPAALSADGKQIAVVDPAHLNRVDAWDHEGKHLGAIIPANDYCVDWLGWSAGGKLLTLSHGKFAAWDVATGKASCEVDGGYPGPVVLAPGRGWVAVCGTDAVDLLDAESGRCLGRCRPKSPGGGFQAVSVSLDGKQLAAARPLVLPPDPEQPDPAKGLPSRRATSLMADIWDLSTGMPVEIPFGVGRLQFLQWRSGRLLLAGSNQPGYDNARLEVLDPALGIVASFVAPKNYQTLSGGSPAIAASADGRIWFYIKNPNAAEAAKTPAIWYAPSLFAADTKTAVVTTADRKFFDLRKEAIRVEVELNEGKASAKVAERLAGDLQRGGFSIGSGNMVLRLTYTLHDSGDILTNDSGLHVNAPLVQFHYRLLDETGAEIWDATKVGVFRWSKSRYYTGSTQDRTAPRDRHGNVDAKYFNFPSKDVQKLIADEILENWSNAPDVALPPAAMLIRAGGITRLLPIREEAKLP